MTQQVAILLAGLCWTCCQSALAWQLCDNGKFQLERDLPQSLSLHCFESYRENSNQQLRVDQKSPLPLKPAKHVCMDTPIIYNSTIPSSGDHRPVGAEPGVYLYCPPQRWLNNIQHGSVVALHHPCAPEQQRGRLTALAQSCLPGYILTAYPLLSIAMPLALVSWGRTLEMSHVTAPEVCDWLVSVSVSSRLRQPSDTERRWGKRYSLLLTHASSLRRPKDSVHDTLATTSQIDRLKSLRNCCEETLSKYENGGTQRERKDKRSHRRERRGVLRGQGESPQDRLKTDSNTHISNVTDLHSNQSSKLNNSVTHSTNMSVETKHPATAVLMLGTARPQKAVAIINPPVQMKEQPGAGEPKEDEKEKEEAPRTGEQEGHSQIGGGGGEGQEQKKVTSAAKTGSHTHSSHAHAHGQTHRKAGVGMDTGAGRAASPRQRVREDTEEQQRLEERETRAPEMAAGGRGSAAVERLPTPRTDEAVWAAAALGFLLVLLTLSVLHTRLYRHWRTSPSLYWHNSAQDYDSVADVIRRRIKMAGRRKRRVAAGRRHEAPLIPNSSAEEESD